MNKRDIILTITLLVVGTGLCYITREYYTLLRESDKPTIHGEPNRIDAIRLEVGNTFKRTHPNQRIYLNIVFMGFTYNHKPIIAIYILKYDMSLNVMDLGLYPIRCWEWGYRYEFTLIAYGLDNDIDFIEFTLSDRIIEVGYPFSWWDTRQPVLIGEP